MGLPWIRLDTSTFDHPKFLELSEAKAYRPIVVHLSGMAYSGKHGLDGFVPRTCLRVIGGSTGDASKLVEVGLWIPTDSGWDINGWREYQFSSEENERRRQKLSERGRKGAEARWSAK